MNTLEKYTKFKKGGELFKKSGIYKVTNLINNKIYIGETTNLESRLNDHICALLRNKHHNEYLQNSINKYGIDNFEFEIIEFCNSYDTKKQEHFWVQFYNTLDKSKGYNIKPTDPNKTNLRNEETSKKIYATKKRLAEERGFWWTTEIIEKRLEAKKGYKHTEETKKKIGNKSIGRNLPRKTEEFKNYMSELAKENNWGGAKKPILQYKKTGEFIKEWSSITEASKNGFLMSGIIQVCQNKPHYKTHKGYVWKYKEM